MLLVTLNEPDRDKENDAQPLDTDKILEEYEKLMARNRLRQIFLEDESTDPKCQPRN